MNSLKYKLQLMAVVEIMLSILLRIWFKYDKLKGRAGRKVIRVSRGEYFRTYIPPLLKEMAFGISGYFLGKSEKPI